MYTIAGMLQVAYIRVLFVFLSILFGHANCRNYCTIKNITCICHIIDFECETTKGINSLQLKSLKKKERVTYSGCACLPLRMYVHLPVHTNDASSCITSNVIEIAFSFFIFHQINSQYSIVTCDVDRLYCHDLRNITRKID